MHMSTSRASQTFRPYSSVPAKCCIFLNKLKLPAPHLTIPTCFYYIPIFPLYGSQITYPTAVFLPLQKFRGPARIPRQVNGLYEDTKVAAHGAQIFRPGRPVSAAVLMWDEGLEERMGGRSEVR